MWAEEGIFSQIPKMNYEGIKARDVEKCGKQSYELVVDYTTKVQYEDYIQLLVQEGFAQHSDNGADGIEGYIYTTNLTKDNITLTVSYLKRANRIHMTASYDLTLSKYLNYNPESMANVKADAKTKLHMLELNCLGSSFVIQLKNGHFVVEDGGGPLDGPYLLDYLESLVPQGEKPVIEGWFISHVHGDHFGALMTIAENEEYSNRVNVEGIYLTAPSDEDFEKMEPKAYPDLIRYSDKICNYNHAFKKEDGTVAEFYRMTIGQKYYFCDITIDVAWTLEQASDCTDFRWTMNDTTTWLMYHIEGQKIFNTGDGNVIGCASLLRYYADAYFEVDVFTTPHHGINVCDWFTEHIKLKTLLYTHWREGSLWWPIEHMTEEEKEMFADYPRERSKWAVNMEAAESNAILQACATEIYSRGEGTVVMTFPYELGTVEIAEPLDWKYNTENPGHPKRYLYTGLEG